MTAQSDNDKDQGRRNKRLKIVKELAGITVKELLLACFDISFLVGAATELRLYKRRAYKQYFEERMIDHRRFYHLVNRVKATGYIDVYLQGKERFVELTKKGKKRLAHYVLGDIEMPLPKSWDKKWRVVVFDIPTKLNNVRDIVRQSLTRLGFYKLQDSVYVYPHDCIGLIRYLEQTYEIDEYVQFIIADRIETDIDLIEIFTERGILRHPHFTARAE